MRTGNCKKDNQKRNPQDKSGGAKYLLGMKRQQNPIYALAITAFLFWAAQPTFGLILHLEGEPNLMSWTDRPPEDVIGRWGSNASCVVIGPNYVITTRHQGGNLNTPVKIGGVTYTISQIWDHNTADLRIAKLSDANLPNFVGVYGNTNEVSKSIVIGGYGVGRGELLQKDGITYGYRWDNAGNTTLRIGTNKIQATINDSALGKFTSDIIIADFDGLNEGWSTTYESAPAGYDSGGGWFIKTGGRWKVAGLPRAVGVHFEEGHEDDPNYAIYNETWFRDRADPNIRLPDYLDAVRISSYTQWIKNTAILKVRGDLDGDGYVDFADFAIVAQAWMSKECQEQDWCRGADFEPDGDVDWADLAEFTNHWLQTDLVP